MFSSEQSRKAYILKSLSFVLFRYKHLDLEGASTWIFASSGEQFTFSEIQIKGNAHLGFIPSGSYGDAASVFAGNVFGDKTGTFVLIVCDLHCFLVWLHRHNNYTC